MAHRTSHVFWLLPLLLMLMFDGSLCFWRAGRGRGRGRARTGRQPELMMYVFDSHIRG